MHDEPSLDVMGEVAHGSLHRDNGVYGHPRMGNGSRHMAIFVDPAPWHTSLYRRLS